jgi:hypothetical protein
MTVSETAGVVAKSHWNNATGATRTTPLALVNDTGASTAAAVTWTSNGIWSTPISDTAGNTRMMKGYLDTSNTSATTVSVKGLSGGTYDLYVYTDGDNHGYARTASYNLTGPGITSTTTQVTDTANTNFSSTFTEGRNSSGNYVKFTFTGTEFTLKATPISGGNSTLRAPVNGLQIVAR